MLRLVSLLSVSQQVFLVSAAVDLPILLGRAESSVKHALQVSSTDVYGSELGLELDDAALTLRNRPNEEQAKLLAENQEFLASLIGKHPDKLEQMLPQFKEYLSKYSVARHEEYQMECMNNRMFEKKAKAENSCLAGLWSGLGSAKEWGSTRWTHTERIGVGTSLTDGVAQLVGGDPDNGEAEILKKEQLQEERAALLSTFSSEDRDAMHENNLFTERLEDEFGRLMSHFTPEEQETMYKNGVIRRPKREREDLSFSKEEVENTRATRKADLIAFEDARQATKSLFHLDASKYITVDTLMHFLGFRGEMVKTGKLMEVGKMRWLSSVYFSSKSLQEKNIAYLLKEWKSIFDLLYLKQLNFQLDRASHGDDKKALFLALAAHEQHTAYKIDILVEALSPADTEGGALMTSSQEVVQHQPGFMQKIVTPAKELIWKNPRTMIPLAVFWMVWAHASFIPGSAFTMMLYITYNFGWVGSLVWNVITIPLNTVGLGVYSVQAGRNRANVAYQNQIENKSADESAESVRDLMKALGFLDENPVDSRADGRLTEMNSIGMDIQKAKGELARELDRFSPEDIEAMLQNKHLRRVIEDSELTKKQLLERRARLFEEFSVEDRRAMLKNKLFQAY